MDPKRTGRPYRQASRSVVDSRGPGHSPEKRTVVRRRTLHRAPGLRIPGTREGRPQDGSEAVDGQKAGEERKTNNGRNLDDLPATTDQAGEPKSSAFIRSNSSLVSNPSSSMSASLLSSSTGDMGLVLQRQFVIMRVFGLVGGSDSSGGGLVPASPSGPVQLCRWCGQLPGQAGEQAADLVAGQRDQLLVVRVAGGGLAGQDGQEGVDEQGQDGPPVPGGPGPDLVLVQGGQFLSASKTVPRPSTATRRPARAGQGAPGEGRGRGRTPARRR